MNSTAVINSSLATIKEKIYELEADTEKFTPNTVQKQRFRDGETKQEVDYGDEKF